ncbi:MAG: helix-turn-helix domain-containing protein [bacterium]
MDKLKVEENEIYTTREVAQILKVSLPTVKRMLKDRRLPSTRIGKQHRFLGRDLLAILTERRDLRRKGGDIGAAVESELLVPGEEPAYVRSLSAIERRQRTYVLGKKTAKPTLAGDGSVLVDVGVAVDDDVIQLARAHKKMMELFSNLEHDEK